nr:hypothetical protein [uncultured Cellulosilyticum sp.]
MSNKFIEYMNSMNNANGDTSNALAESQVDNTYYREIKVERQLGKQIIEDIKNGKRYSYIITGHAGDGKTSILAQVLDDLSVLREGQKLEIKGSVSLEGGASLIYVKDMSELPAEKQVEYMREVLEAPKNGDIGILISNTGPLISTYKEVVREQDENYDESEVENFLLEQLDTNKDIQLEKNNYQFYLVNLARLDNTWFATKLIDKITQEKLWVECENCGKGEQCPIYFNYRCLKENKESVSQFVEDYYRYLYEQDKRMTIRQIVAHISYALTGNLDCSHIKIDNNKYITYVNNFANLFFGYKGIHQRKDALQIKSINEIQNLQLDKKSLKDEYDLFVRNDFTRFNSSIKAVVEEYWNSVEARIAANNLYQDDKDSRKVRNAELLKYRQSLRRFMIMYSYIDSKNNISLGNEIFGSMFELYKKALYTKQTRPELKIFHNVIFNALYINYVGIPPRDKGSLYITLRREDKNQQNSLLLLGEARSNELEIVQKSVMNKFEDSDNEGISTKYFMCLRMKNEEYDLDFPLLNYFYNTARGAIYGKVNSDLSHGLAKLNVKLLKAFKYREDGGEFKVLVSNGGNPSILRFEILNDRLYVE